MRTPSLIGLDVIGARPSFVQRLLSKWRVRRVLGDPREEFKNATRIVLSPPTGASTTIQAPRLVTVRGGERSVPPASFSKDTVYYKNPKSVTVEDGGGTPRTFSSVDFIQIYGGSGQIIAGDGA